jgi:hypothetical protein
MSDTKSPEPKKLPVAQKVEEPGVGEGGRSLANWEKLASARRDLSSNAQARSSMKNDPKAFLATYGINAAAFSETGGQMGLTSLERQLAFSGGVERDSLGVHRGCELVVGPVAGAVAGAVVGAAAAAVTGVYAANVAWATNWVCGAGTK